MRCECGEKPRTASRLANRVFRMSFLLLWLQWVTLLPFVGTAFVQAREYFEVEIETSEQNLAWTSNPTPVFTVNFNARNLTDVNPLKLFEISGSNRVDVVYSQSLGEMYVMAAVDNTSVPGTVILTVNEGVTSSDQGGTNSYAQAQVQYVPDSQQGNAIADIAGWGMLGGLAVSFGATLFAPAATIGVGAINFAGFVQTFYMSGNLPITNMPDNYRSSTSGLVADWVLLNPPVGPIVEDNTSKKAEREAAIGVLRDLSVKMPYPPVMITYEDAGDVVFVDVPEDPDVNDSADSGADGQVVEDVSMPVRDQVQGGLPISEDSKSPVEPKATVETASKEVVASRQEDRGAEETNKDDRVKVDDLGNGENQDTSEGKGEMSNGSVLKSTDDSNLQEAGIEDDDSDADDDDEDDVTDAADDEEDVDEDDEEDDDEDSSEGPRPPKKPPVVTPIPDEALNGDDGNPLSPFKPPPKKPPPKRPSGAEEGEKPQPDGPFVKPLIGDDDGKKKKNDKKNDEAHVGGKDQDGSESGDAQEDDGGQRPKSPKPKDDEGPFVQPLIGDDDGYGSEDDSKGGKEGWHDDSLAYEDLDYLIPKIPSDSSVSEESESSEDLSKDVAEDGEVASSEHTRDKSRRLLSSVETPKSRRRLMLSDPISSLGSSGFSYVIVTATTDDVTGNMTILESSEDAVGASILSRIRAIEVLGESSDHVYHLDVLWNVLFWSAILLAGIMAIHILILGVMRALRLRHIPKMLHLPRIELLTFTMTVPMIAAAGAAALRSDSAGAIAAGVCFGILLPFGFLIGASLFLIYAVFRPTVSKRRAVYVLSEDSPMFFMPSDEQVAAIRERTGQSSDSTAQVRPVDSSVSRISDGLSEDEDSPADPQVESIGGKPNVFYKYFVSPVFGFSSPNRAAHVPGDARISQDKAQLQWLGRGKTDGKFVKRFGLFFEDAHGPQVVRVRSRYEWNSTDADSERNTVGGAVLVPSVEGAMEILQTFAIIFAATKMVLFAVIINAPGGVNHIAQVIALALVSLFHIAYLRICVPYRLRIELAAELVAAVMDLAVFICGVILVAISDWSSAARSRMGTAMIVLQAIGFLVFITARLALALRTCWTTFKLPNIGALSGRGKRGRDSKDKEPTPTDAQVERDWHGREQYEEKVTKVVL